MALDLPQQQLLGNPTIMPFLNATVSPAASAPLQLNNVLEGITGLPNVSYNGLGMVPQMGCFGCAISEETITSAAEKLVSSGLRDLGYTYVLIDDCWQASARHADGKPHYDEKRFPSGLKQLTDKLHAMGLKAGIYSSAGDHTCALQFGSLGYEEIDAQAYADWGFDYLKYDNCFSAGLHGTPDLSFRRYKTMSDALLATDRPIWYSLCNWGQDQVWTWASSISNSYRTTGDIDDTFDDDKPQCPKTAWTTAPEGYGCSVANIIDKASPIMQKAVRGCWPDQDMLEVGRGGMTTDEQIVHFSMWALMKSPLIMGNDLTKLDDLTLGILGNKALIAFHQGTVGGANPLTHVTGGPGEVQIWKAAVGDGSFAVAIVNFTTENKTLDIDFKTLFRDDGRSAQGATYRPDDFWSAEHFPLTNSLSADFGSANLPETVSGALKALEVRAKAGRFWKFEPADEAERKRALADAYAMQPGTAA